MSRNLALIGAAAASLLVVGCRNDNNNVNPADFASGGPVDMAGSPQDGPSQQDGPSSMACTTYTMTSIAAMRQGKPGCMELDNVVSIGLTPSTKSPRLFVQDAAGGDFSAMMVKCSSTSTTHPCTVASTVANIANGHKVTVQGTYIKSSSTMFEEFFVDTITDNGAGTAPAVGTATLAQIQRNGTAHNLAFQKVTTTIAAADKLLMYDWTPSEFVYSGATKCPYQFGWGMIPASVGGVTMGLNCASQAQPYQPPPMSSAPNAGEVLIGTDFYSGFHVSSDCRCTTMFQDKQPATSASVTGAITGLLVFDVPFGGTTGYFYLAPQADTDFPISPTM
jgi:hypothetical protein